MRTIWLPKPVAAALVAGLSCWLPAATAYAQIVVAGTSAAATNFQGQAAAVSGIAGGGVLSVANTGLAASGGAQEAAELGLSLAGGVSVGASHAATIGQENAVSSEASVADVSFTSGGGFFVAGTTIAAAFVMSRASTACAAVGAAVSGASEVDGLVIDGQPVAVTGQANQVVFLSSGGFAIINEQLATASGMTVNGLHVFAGGASVVFASATAGLACAIEVTPPPQPCGDFVTGGGWITGTPSGARANFGVAGGMKNGALWGHLNYIDHGNGMHVKATAVTGYAVDPNDADCRIIDYAVTIDGQPGTARVRVCDKGEPGRNDIFEIHLSNGYSAGGDLGGTHPGGGNIQLHECH